MAQIAFINGVVHTVDDHLPRAEAVLVEASRIAAVGTVEEVRQAASRSAQVVDLEGGALLPGMQDSHNHAVHAGVEMLQCNLAGLPVDRSVYLTAIAEYATTHPEAEWIIGAGWAMDAFPGGIADAAGVDAVVPDRPVYLLNKDHHGAWVNSRAMEMAGIDRSTPDPGDGRIERRADGSPVGMLQEGATELVARVAPKPSPADRAAGLEAAQRYLLSFGITAWQDAWVLDEDHSTYVDAAGSGTLRARVIGAAWWDRNRGAEQIDEILARRAEAPDGRYRATSVKIMQDGVCENHTAGLLAPYLDGRGSATSNSGLSFIEPDALMGHVAALDGLGFQIHFHALGDRAVRECLDAVAHARAVNGMNDNRHHLAHLQIVDPADIARFFELRAAASAQPLWANHDGYQNELTIPFLGPERSALQYPFRSLLDAGATLALGSDWPVSTPNPWQIMHVAVNRSTPSGDGRVFYPEQRITQLEALLGYTMGSAWVNHLDEMTGSITPGKLADLIVVDRDPLRDGFYDTEVALTMIGGEVVHER